MPVTADLTDSPFFEAQEMTYSDVELKDFVAGLLNMHELPVE